MECGIGRKGVAEGALIVLEMITGGFTARGGRRKSIKSWHKKKI